jgi:hypothetical protein
VTSCSYHASKDAVGSCVSCGKLICRACQSEIDDKSYCPPCVEKLFTAKQSVAQATPAFAAAKPVGQAVNPAWWLLPVFLSWVGGLAAWLANKERNAGVARYMLFTGIGMAVIQGLVGLILVFALLAPSAVTPGRNPSAATSLPRVTSPAPTATTSINPSPLTSQAQPQDFKVEEAKIDEVIDKLSIAFKAKDVEESLNYFQAEERDKYRKIFSQSPEAMPEMAADLEKAKINFVAFNSNQYSRIAEYLVKSGEKTFSIVFINIDGQWLLKAF